MTSKRVRKKCTASPDETIKETSSLHATRSLVLYLWSLSVAVLFLRNAVRRRRLAFHCSSFAPPRSSQEMYRSQLSRKPALKQTTKKLFLGAAHLFHCRSDLLSPNGSLCCQVQKQIGKVYFFSAAHSVVVCSRKKIGKIKIDAPDRKSTRLNSSH